MKLFRWVVLTGMFLGNLPFGWAVESHQEKQPVTAEDRQKVLKAMAGFAGSLQGMPVPPKMDETIILPERNESDPSTVELKS